MFTKTYTSLCPVAIASGNTNPAAFKNLIGFLRSRSLTLLTLWIWMALGLSQALAQPGECLDFDGSNDIVTIADGSWNDFGSSDFTVEAWVKKQAGSSGWSNLTAVGKWNTGASPGTNEWLMALTSDGADEKPTFSVEIGATVYKAIGTTSMTVGTWYHIACVREGTDIKLYVNGVLEATTAIGMTSINNVSGRHIKLARIDGFGGHTNMEMDELRIWDDARSAAEIADLKDCEIPTAYTDLLANYHFNQGTAGGSNPGETSLGDDAGSSRDGALTGFALTGGTSNWVAPGPTPNGVSCLPVHNVTKDLYYSTIQDAVDGADPGDDISVSSGTYNETVILKKSLNLSGAGCGLTIWKGTAITDRALVISRDAGMPDDVHVEITGFSFETENNQTLRGDWSTVYTEELTLDIHGNCFKHVNTRNPGTDFALWVDGANQVVRGATGALRIYDNLFDVVTGGVLFEQCRAVDVLENTFNVTYEAVAFNYGGSSATTYGDQLVSRNTFTHVPVDWAFAINNYHYGSGTYTMLPTTVSNNIFTSTGFTYAVVYGVKVSQSGTHMYSINDNSILSGTILKWGGFEHQADLDATCNWWGTTDYTLIVPRASVSVDLVPYLVDGTDSDLMTLGFQPVAGSCTGGPVHVYSDLAETMLVSTHATIQDAIDDAATLAGYVVRADDGTFTENVSITKSLSLRGANYGTDGCSGGRGSESIVDGLAATAFTIMAGGVVIDGFEIRGATGVSSSGYTGVSVRNNKFAVDGVGISVSSAATSPGSTWAIEDNCIDLAAQLFGGTPTYGILLAGISGTAAATVDGNDISDGFYGYIAYGIATTPVTRIENGSVTGAMQGVALVNTLGGPLAPIDIEIVSLSLTSFSGSHPGLPAVNFHAGVYTYTAGSTMPLESIDAIIRGCTIDGTGSVSPAGAAVYIGDFSAGPATVQTIVVDENTITDNLNRGVDSRGYVSTTITQNTFSGNGSAPWGAGGNDGFTIIARNGATVMADNNFITHPASSTYPVTALFTGNAPVSTIAASDNSILMNGNAMAKGATSAVGTGSIDAECNWWGVTGSSVPPLMSGTVDYELFLTSGVDDDLVTAGFQPQANTCNGCSSGNLVTNTNTGEFFCTIQDAIDDAETLDGHTLDVSAGTYAEDVLVDKELTIRGPNHSIDPCSGMRVPEAIVVPKTKDIASTVLFYIDANTDDVTIKGFTMDGDNPSLTSGFSSTNGADIDAAEAVATYETGVDNLVVKNNIIKNLSYFGVTHYDYPAGVASTGHEISNNKFLDLGTYDAGSGISFWGGGVLLYNNGYAHVHDNCMTNVRIGVQTGNYYRANPGAGTYQRIEDNTMSVRRRGIFHNLFYSSASPYTLDDNTITAVDHASEIYWDGILVSSHQGVSSTTSNNDIDGTLVPAKTSEGLEVWNVRSTAPAIISGGTVTGVDIGLFVNNYEGYASDAGEGAHTTVSGLVATDCPIGAKIFDSPSSTLHAAVSATIKDDCEFNHSSSGTTGILVSGAAASAIIKDNDASIDGYSIGVDVDAATATVENNHIYNNGIGVRFTNGGDGTVTKNKFYDAAEPNGTDVQKTATGGSVTAGPDNWYAGSTYGVENLSATSVDATLNYWNAADGPGPVGSGSGTPITTLVDYCQYLNDEPTHLGGSPTATSPTVVILVDESSGVADDDGIICNGASVTLDATTTGATGYLWSTTATTASITVSPSSTTGYTVTVTFPDCTVSDDQTITVEALPSCSITGADGPLCPSASETYAGPAGMSSYSWSITGSGTIPGSTSDPTVSVSASATCSGSFTLTLVITDGDGCSSSCSKVVTVEDVTGPTVTTGGIATCYPTLAAAEAAALTETTATDNCPGALTETAITTGTCSATISVTVTDACGNANTAIYATRIDGMAPVFTTCPVDLTVYTAPGLCGRSVSYSAPAATDNCTASPTIVKTDGSGYMSGDFFPVGTTPQTFTATDECGNVSTCSFTVTVIDDEDPVITGCPPNITVSTTPGLCTGTATWVAPTASDNCPGVLLTLVPYLPPSSTFPKGSTLLTYTATDVSLNLVTCAFTVVVEDNEDPTITGCPGNQTRDADSGGCDYSTAGTEFDPTSYDDNCPMEVLTYALSGATTGSGTNTLAGVDFQKGTTTVVWTVTDMSGNTETCSFDIVVIDDEDPTISCPGTQTRNTDVGECNYTAVVAGEFDPTGYDDNCPMETISNDYDMTSSLDGSDFPKGTTTVVWTVTDMSNNTASCTFNVVVSDVELPTISCPSNPSNRTTDPGVCDYTTVGGEFDPAFADNCPMATIENDYNNASTLAGAVFPVGTTTVEWTVTDMSGNTKTCAFDVVVVDDELPTVTCPPNVTLTATSGTCQQIHSWTVPVPADNCGVASMTVSTSNPSVVIVTIGTSSFALFPVGTTTVTYLVTDVNGNTNTCSFTVLVKDTENPVITGCPSNIGPLGNDPGLCGRTVSWTAPTASDNCPGVSLATTHFPGSFFAIGTTMVTYTATDAGGLTATCSFTVTIEDTEDPAITCPADMTVGTDPGSCDAVVSYTAPVGTDNCPGASTSQIAGLASGATFPIGTTTNTFRVTDGAGNSTTCSFDVTVEDDEAPSITCPASTTVDTDPGVCTAVVSYTAPVGTDNCPGASTVQTSGLASGSSFPLGTTTNTFRVTDGAGNSTTCSFDVTVEDNEDPGISCEPAQTIVLNGSCQLLVPDLTDGASAMDNCSAGFTWTQSPASGSLLASGDGTTHTVTVTVDDGNGNTATCTVVLTGDDTTPPSVTCEGPQTIVLNASCELVVPDLTDGATGSDNCGSLSWSQSPTASTALASGEGTTHTVTVTASDGNGNTATCTVVLTGDDATPPTPVCETPQTITLTGACILTVPNLVDMATATDNCSSSFTWSQSPIAGTGLTSGEGTTHTVTVTVSDGNGNTATCTTVLTGDDVTPPTPVCEAPQTIALDADCELLVPDLTDGAVVLDNCSTSFTWSQSPAAGSELASGEGTTHTVTVTVSDGNGNSATCTTVLTGDDATSPSISCEPGQTVILSALCLLSVPDVLDGSVGSDNCGSLTWSQSPTLGTLLSSGEGATHTVTVTADDGNGNTSTCTVVLTGDDATPPVPTCEGPQTIVLDADCELLVPDLTDGATATDNCSSSFYWSQSPTAGAELASGEGTTHTVTVTADDGNGNTSTCTVVLTGDDTTPPVPTCESAQTITLDAECELLVPDLTDMASALDNCSSSFTWGQSPAAGAELASGEGTTHTVTVTADDGNGNSATCTVVLTGDDVTAPSISCESPQSVSLDATCKLPVPDLTDDAAGSDNCGSLSWSQSPTMGTLLTSGEGVSHTVTVTADDGNGNTTTCTVVLTGDDDTPPVPSCEGPQTIALDAECELLVPDLTDGASATDNCSLSFYWSQSPTSGTELASGEGTTHTITVTVDDTNGNTSTCTVVLTGDDVTAPSISCEGPATIALNASCELAVPDLTDGALGSDNCSSLSWSQSPTMGTLLSSGEGTTHTVTVSATDGNGNTSTCTVVLTGDDVTPPVPSCEGAQTIALDAECELLVPDLTDGATATDNCATSFYWSQSPTSGTELASGEGMTHTVTVTVDDGNGNTSTCTVVLTGDDTTPPVPVCEGPETISLNAACILVVTNVIDMVSATDNCSSSFTWSQSPIAGSALASGEGVSHTITVTVSDGNGNSATCTTVLTGDDVTPPTPICEGPQTVSLNGDCELPVPDLTDMAVAIDNCSSSFTWSQSPGAGAELPSGEGVTHTVTVTADDGNGNTATCTVVLTGDDDTSPSISCEAAQSVSLTSLCQLVVPDVLDGSTGSDNCGSLSWSQSPTLGTILASDEGVTHTVTVTADDGNGNTSSCTVVLTGDDTTPPVPTCEGPQTIVLDAECELLVPDLTDGASATDNCSSSFYWSQSPTAGAELASGEGTTHTITITADDGNGNTATCTVVLTGDDTTPPVPTCEAAQTIMLDAECDLLVPDVTDGSTADDNCATSFYWSQSPTAGTELASGEGTTHTVTVTVDDTNGNTATCTVVLTGDDTTPPAPVCEGPQDVTLDVDCELVVLNLIDGATVTDNCSSSFTWAQSPAAGASLPSAHNMTHTVTVTVDDGNGNSATCTTVLTGKDVTYPTMTCPANLMRGMDEGLCRYTVGGAYSGGPGEFDGSASDNCGVVSKTWVLTGVETGSGSGSLDGQLWKKGVTTVTWTATDAAGNSTTCSFMVEVKDLEPPSITCPPNITVTTLPGQCSVPAGSVSLGTPTVSDNCGVKYPITNNSPASYPVGVTTVKWTVKDSSNNKNTCNQKVTVIAYNCGQPVNVYHYDTTTSSAKIAWSAGLCATSYQLRIRKEISPGVWGPWSSWTAASGPGNKHSFTGLDDGSYYHYQIRSKCGTTYSNIVNGWFFTLTAFAGTEERDRNDDQKEYVYRPVDVELVPNPASVVTKVFITGFDQRVKEVTMMDLLGKKVFSVKLKPNQNILELDMNVLEARSGMYLIQVSDGYQQRTEQLIIER